MRVNRLEVPVEQVERAPGPGAELGPVALEDPDGGGQGGQGRAQLVADVGGEPGLPLDPVLRGWRSSG